MNNKFSISYSDSFYKFTQIESITTIDMYYKFKNWVAAEFDLYFKEESSDLKVYIPNGRLNIRSFLNPKKEILVEISVESKSKKICEFFLNEVLSAYNHLVLISMSNSKNQ